MIRVLALVLLFAATGSAVLAYGDAADLARARDAVAQVFTQHVFTQHVFTQHVFTQHVFAQQVFAPHGSANDAHGLAPRPMAARTAEVPRGNGGEFALKARINGIAAPMLIDTGAT